MSEELSKDLRAETAAIGVCFDQDEATLEGVYQDELSTYRAKKVWTETLETNFLLESDYDFIFKIVTSLDDGKFVLKCNFNTACGRYAFWRLTRNQAPEAQHQIETAHIPQKQGIKVKQKSSSHKEDEPVTINHNYPGRIKAFDRNYSAWLIFKRIKKLFK